MYDGATWWRTKLSGLSGLELSKIIAKTAAFYFAFQIFFYLFHSSLD